MLQGFTTASRLATRLLALGGRLLPNQCLLCSTSLTADLLCTECQLALPYLTGLQCRSCALPLESDSPYCGQCLSRPPAFSHSLIPFLYGYPLDSLIHRFKYGGRLTYGRSLSDMLAGFVENAYRERQPLATPDALIPVPMHWTRRFRRGFNQAELLGRDLSRALGISHQSNLCRRHRRTPTQSGLSGKERQRNLRRAFSLRPGAERFLAGRCVALVDDVVTTGSTARALARLLMDQGGADEVHVWALARTPAQSHHSHPTASPGNSTAIPKSSPIIATMGFRPDLRERP